ncbi:PREDICTED: LOW QUALITY PROTEIN: LINE-1 type transposase domain-containing protein 1 [Myotis davidii]|uniref:LOW QUALITY PROTEIN: LINE-1 type transposase domain-containing protein 1 n=1 Tax=Myotis davidii TaxID=225400 RepID=UPI0003EC4F00|nr:PREDICTED: LOW QUALITY PROTEIN: LINE-1 type transposase domain-containing protein 1 [Myotis davidii]
MYSVQSEIPTLAKKLESSFHMEMIQLIETEMVQLLDLKYKDISAVIMNKFKVLMENMDLMVVELRESLKNELKEILGVKSTMLELKNPKNPSTRKEWQQIKDITSIKTGLVEKIEGENYIEDIENLTFKRSEIVKLSSKLDQSEDYNTNQGKELSLDDSENHKVKEIFSKQWSNVFNILRENDFEPKIFYAIKLAFKCDGEIRTFSDMQSLRKFISQKSFMKELLKGALPENENRKKGGRRYGIQEKMNKTLIASKYEAVAATSDGLSFLFIEEVKVAEAEEVKSLEAHEEEASESQDEEACELEEEEKEEDLEEHEEEASETQDKEALEEEEACELEEEEKEEDLEEGEETSGLKQEASELEEGENSELGEEEEVSELEQGAEYSGPEEETASELCNQQNFHYHSLAHGAESEELDSILTEETECYELQEGESSEWESERYSPWPEGEDSEAEETTSQTEEKELSCTHLASDSEKKKLVKCKLTSKETDLLQETEENFRRSVINSLREIQEEIGDIKNYHPGNKKLSTLSVRIDILKEKVNHLEDRIEEFSKDTRQMAKQIIIKERIREVEDRSRSSNIRLIGIPEKVNKENGAEEIVKEIIEENFAELKKRSSLDIVSAFRIPSKIDKKRTTPRHILVKFGSYSDREKITAASREKKQVTYRGIRIRMTADLSLDTLDARSQWGSIIRCLEAKGFKPRILYPAKLAFDFEGKTKVFFYIEEFRKFISCIPSLKESLENIF